MRAPNFTPVSATSRFITLPNLLSLARFPLAAAFVAAESARARVALLVAAALSDLLDGWLARRSGSTRTGALLDPIADKAFVLLAISTFLWNGELSVRDYLILLSRDLATAVGFVVAFYLPGLDPADFKARWPGKLVTVLQLLSLLSLLVRRSFVPLLVPLVGVASAWTIVDYTLALHRARARS
jgi:cardiolipin synthase (CMP-forming)